MEKSFSVDSMSPTSCSEIKDYLYSKLENIISVNRPIIFLCIGTDRSTGDSLGPLVGYKLKTILKEKIYIYGSLENPIHAVNLTQMLERIHHSFNNPYIIAIDACLGNVQNVGKVFIDEKPLSPGLAVNKDLPPVGNMSITGIVNISGNLEFMVLQNTRLYTVMALADCISNGIHKFIIKINSSSSNSDFDIGFMET